MHDPNSFFVQAVMRDSSTLFWSYSAMKFCVIHQQTSTTHIVEARRRADHGPRNRWVNRYLDREYVRRIADTTLRTYAHNLLTLSLVESVHHTRHCGR